MRGSRLDPLRLARPPGWAGHDARRKTRGLATTLYMTFPRKRPAAEDIERCQGVRTLNSRSLGARGVTGMAQATTRIGLPARKNYIWDLRQTTTLQRLRALRRSSLSVQNEVESN